MNLKSSSTVGVYGAELGQLLLCPGKAWSTMGIPGMELGQLLLCPGKPGQPWAYLGWS